MWSEYDAFISTASESKTTAKKFFLTVFYETIDK